jgi:hypothetical protein
MKKEQQSIDLRAQKMMGGKVEPSIVPTVLTSMPTMV